MGFGDIQLFPGHVHPYHMPVLTHELGYDVHVPPGTASQVQDRKSLQERWDG